MEKIIISCLESRVETNRSVYARFLLGPFKDDNAVTIAAALRRSLLSKVKNIAITAVHIQGVTHEFSTIVGVRESVLDLALNFQQVILRTKADRQITRNFENVNSINEGEFQTMQVGYLQVQGPKVVYANDLKLPEHIECVDPTQYIATLSTESLLVVKFIIGKKKISFDKRKMQILCKSKVVTKSKLLHDVQVQDLVEPKQSFGQVRSVKQSFVYKMEDSQKISVRTNFLQSFERDFVNSKSSLFAKDKKGFLYAKHKVNARHATVKSFDKQQKNIFLQINNPIQFQSDSLDNFFRSFDPTICLRNVIFLDPIFESVLQANYVIERDDAFNQARERVVIEFWTNGSVHPRQALHKASLSLISTFSIFRDVFQLDSL